MSRRSALQMKQDVRKACRQFIRYPSFKTLWGIIQASKDPWSRSSSVPCFKGEHRMMIDYWRRRCQGCPLMGFQQRINPQSEWCCAAHGLMDEGEARQLYEKYSGELVIAMVKFNEGWLKKPVKKGGSLR